MLQCQPPLSVTKRGDLINLDLQFVFMFILLEPCKLAFTKIILITIDKKQNLSHSR